jgi:hypothetical protein
VDGVLLSGDILGMQYTRSDAVMVTVQDCASNIKRWSSKYTVQCGVSTKCVVLFHYQVIFS